MEQPHSAPDVIEALEEKIRKCKEKIQKYNVKEHEVEGEIQALNGQIDALRRDAFQYRNLKGECQQRLHRARTRKADIEREDRRQEYERLAAETAVVQQAEVDEFLQEVRDYLLHPGIARDYMQAVHTCHRLCTNECEEQILVGLCGIFLDFRARSAMAIDIAQGKRRYILNHPIIAAPDMNRRIAYEAFGTKERSEYQGFLGKAQTVARISRYLERFYVPNSQKWGKRITVQGETYLIQAVFDMLKTMWGEPPDQ